MVQQSLSNPSHSVRLNQQPKKKNGISLHAIGWSLCRFGTRKRALFILSLSTATMHPSTCEIEMDTRNTGGKMAMPRGDGPSDRQNALPPSRLSLLLWIRRIRHGGKEAKREGRDRMEDGQTRRYVACWSQHQQPTRHSGIEAG